MAETNVMNGGVEPGADVAKADNGAMGDGNRSGQDVEKTYSQEEFDKALQSESDKRVNQALEKAKAEWQKDYEAKLQAEKDEAARLAKMNADERAKAEFEKERKTFEAERSKYQKDKLTYECSRQLGAAGLPIDFAEMLTGADADSTKSNIDAFGEKWKDALEKAVTERLKGAPPKTAHTNKETDAFERALSGK